VEKGISFHDFVMVQRKVRGTSGLGGQPTLLQKQFAQAVTDYSVASIKKFMEAKAKEDEVDLENERRIKAAAAERRAAMQRVKLEKQKEEEEKKRKEEEHKQRRAAMKARAAAFDAPPAN
jgi:DNA-binding transcriptional MerR regulator